MRVLIVLTFALASHFALAKPVSLKSRAGSGKVEFLAVGKPRMVKIHGKAGGPTASLRLEERQLKGSIAMDLTKLETGISLRDEHMKTKYLHVKEHPQATLTLLEAPVDAAFETGLSNSGENAFKGKLKLHGKEKEVAGRFSVKAGVVNATFPITLTEFGVEVPSYLGITVAEKVDVTVELPLTKE